MLVREHGCVTCGPTTVGRVEAVGATVVGDTRCLTRLVVGALLLEAAGVVTVRHTAVALTDVNGAARVLVVALCHGPTDVERPVNGVIVNMPSIV